MILTYPNPFNPSTTINYSIPADGYVTLSIYSVLGEEVVKLESGYKTAGKYSYLFNASNFSIGAYFFKIQVRDFVETKKMLLLR